MRIVLFFMFGLLASCNQSTEPNGVAAGSTEHIDVAKFAELMQGDVQILDVRTTGEYAQGYIQGAINLDVQGSGFIQSLSALDKEKAVLIYCRSGKRSARAMSLMHKEGFSELYNLQGGYLSWASSQ